MDVEAKINSLKRKEITHLFLICHGYTNDKISKAFNEPIKTTSSRITRIYKKLKITGDDQEKRDIISGIYCPTVKKKIQTLDDLKYWTPIPLPVTPGANNDNDETGNSDDDDDNPDDIDNWTLPLPPGSQTKKLPPPPKGPESEPIRLITEKELRRRNWILGSVIIVLIGLVVYLLFRGPNPIFPIAAANTTPTETSAITLTNFAAVTEVPTQATTPAPIHTDTPAPTETPTPTETQLPSATPTVTPTPTLASWFYDDFTDGFDPEWARLSDDLVIVGGEVTYNGNYGKWMYIPAPDTPNYLIEFKVRFIRTNNWGLMVAPAFVDPDNFYAFRSNWNNHEWILKKGQPQRTVGETSKIEMEKQLGSMTVQGRNIGIKLNSFEFDPIYNDQIEMGNIGFYIDNKTFLDEVRITLLP